LNLDLEKLQTACLERQAEPLRHLTCVARRRLEPSQFRRNIAANSMSISLLDRAPAQPASWIALRHGNIVPLSAKDRYSGPLFEPFSTTFRGSAA
jgi:hypothetical protein